MPERQYGFVTALQTFPVFNILVPLLPATDSSHSPSNFDSLEAPPQERWAGGRGGASWSRRGLRLSERVQGPERYLSKLFLPFMHIWEQWVETLLSLVAVAWSGGAQQKVLKACVTRLPSSCLVAWPELSTCALLTH